ncbi:MAG: FAD binding domain-containing protein [Anaerolineaceae bacterium]
MWSSLVEYQRPDTMAKCLRLLARQYPHTVPLAGGTWLVAQRDPQVEAVVDLSGLNLAFIKQSTQRIRLGALTTLQDLIESPIIQELTNGFLRDASYKSASRTTRNIATLGGTIVVGNSTSDLCLALLVLDAHIVIRSPREIVVPLNDFYANRASYMLPTSIITEISIPKKYARIGTASMQVSRTPQDQPIVNASALVSQIGSALLARLALGGVTDYPIRLPMIEGLISHQKVDAALYDLVAQAVQMGINNYPLSEYQREMAGIVVTRALQKAWERAEKE